MRQRNLAVSTRTSSGASSGKVESQYLVGAFSPSGHSISNHSSAGGAANCQSREADPYPNGGEARGQGLVGALAPSHGPPSLFGQFHRQRLGRNGLMFGVPPRARGLSPAPAPRLGR